ncbi:MAG: ABC transporter permease [Kiloniellales bacterium]|nr:ABC transporter permease [Kiloniellales bacterium]
MSETLPRRAIDWPHIVTTYGTAMGAVALILFFSLAAENFINPINLLNVLKQISYLAIIATGFTLALMAGELDLSIANVASLASVVTASLLFGGQPVWLGIAAGLAIALCLGLANGVLVTRFKVPSLIATLAVATIANGLSFLITEGVAYVGKLDPAFLFLGRGRLFDLPVLILWVVIIAGLALFFVKQTRAGVHLVASGEAEEAARLAGIATRRMKVIGLTLSGLGAGIVGILLTSALSSSSPTIAGEFLMTGIAAVLLGMTMIEPGKPNIPGTLIGTLTIGVLSNGLTLLGAEYYVQDIVLGVIILLSVSLSASQLRRAAFGVTS